MSLKSLWMSLKRIIIPKTPLRRNPYLSVTWKSANYRNHKQGIEFQVLIKHFRRKIRLFYREIVKVMQYYPKSLHRGIPQVPLKPSLLFSSASGLISAFDWDSQRISNDELIYHFNEINYVHLLLKMTLICPKCKKRLKFEDIDSKIEYCICQLSEIRKYKNWEPFLERSNLIFWRKFDKNSYKYRVYGQYDDVSAINFLRVQIDLDYRKVWDSSVEKLKIVEKDPNPSLNSDIIYWEMKWPMLFENRDFVFNRRFIVHNDENVIVILNKVTKHPECPSVPGKTRVSNYWSCMVIKPFNKMHEPGMEFSLCYFDNHNTNLPTKILTWVAMKAMPEFLLNVYTAAKYYESYCSENSIEPFKILNFNDTNKVIQENTNDDGSNLDDKMYTNVNFWKHQIVSSFNEF